MAANKFATVLHRNSHRMAVILVYAILEWALILFLLLNGLFGYLIARFAAFFGLKAPCIFCSRVDHLFEKDEGRRRHAYRDLLCDEHAAEVTKLGYCAYHRRLAEAGEMCEDCCFSTRPVEAAVLSWMKRSEEGEKDLRCSCCDVVLESGFYSPYLLFKPSWGAVEYDHKGNLVDEVAVVDRELLREDAVFCQEKVERGGLVSPDQVDGFHDDPDDDKEEEEEEDHIEVKINGEEATDAIISKSELEELETLIDFSVACPLVEDASLEVLTRYLENVYDEDRLIPVELIDSATMTKSHAACVFGKQDQIEFRHLEGEEVGRDESKAVAFTEERPNFIEKNSSGNEKVEDDGRSFDKGSITGVEKGLVSAIEMADIVEANPSGNVEVENKAMVVDVGCIMEEEKLSSLAVGSADVVKENSSEDVAVELQSDALEYTVFVTEEENMLASAEERADTTEETSSEMNEAPQCSMADTVEDNSSETDGSQQNAMILDIGITPAEGDVSSLSNTERGEILEQNSVVLPSSENIGECSSDHQFVAPLATPMITSPDGGGVQVESLMGEEDLPGTQAYEEDNKLIDVETNCEISIGSEICDQEHIDHAHRHEPILMSESTHEEPSESYNDIIDINREMPAAKSEPIVTTAQCPDHIAGFQEHNEIEEERQPETPTSSDGINNLHKRFLFGRRESGTESLDGSVAGEFEGCDTLTGDQLKAALQAERKTLSALYAELEEERSAAAIAANQTMAMITRLQEEKAAMQMEALQYQRMMEEQSEYDQEALQLLNELMTKREKEKQDLEKELEVYRKKVLRHEAKERRQMAQNKVDGKGRASSASSSAEDSDDLLFEFQQGDEFTCSPNESNQNTPTDAVLSSGAEQGTEKHLITLNESLADFEEERLSILEQLRALEKKLLISDDEDPQNLDAVGNISDANGHVSNGNCEPLIDDLHDDVNGSSEELEANRKLHSEQRNIVKGKRLLPLFDAIDNENEDDICIKEEAIDASPETILNVAEEQKQLAIIEEVDNIYERLQALEADREFLKHCISSLKKGDKGIHLLQEILEHLHDLRSVELRARNSCDYFPSFAA
ncbi:myosin-binding protein 2 [Musa acuminata AAA Group]|uniref:myosin-binding protein 2 n=1 Tax=Musa acuminata AAA Group TaxID=214697 RepID=UPI0031CF8A8E